MHSGVLLSLAKVYHELQDYGRSADFYRTLAQRHPDTAANYSYLNRESGSRTRASDVVRQRRLVEWEDDQ